MARIVSEKIPQAKRWPAAKEFKSWVDSLSAEEFETYLARLSMLTRSLSDEQMPKETGIFVVGKSYPVSQIGVRSRLARIGGEATGYYALALWRTLQAEKLITELRGNESNRSD